LSITGEVEKIKESFKLFKKGIKMDPKYLFNYYDMALNHLILNDQEKALKYFNKIDELSPEGFFKTKTAIYYLNLEGDNKV
jgi:tetratricopeptide (TPR) repeat protein